MTVGESLDVSMVLQYLLCIEPAGAASAIDAEMARAAALRLMERGHDALRGTLTAEQVARAWPSASPRRGRGRRAGSASHNAIKGGRR